MLPTPGAAKPTSPRRDSTLEFVLFFRRGPVAQDGGRCILGGRGAICRELMVTVVRISRSRLIHYALSFATSEIRFGYIAIHSLGLNQAKLIA